METIFLQFLEINFLSFLYHLENQCAHQVALNNFYLLDQLIQKDHM